MRISDPVCYQQGVCATALKRACRKLGVKKWPYREQQCSIQRVCTAPVQNSNAGRQIRSSVSNPTGAASDSRSRLASMGIKASTVSEAAKWCVKLKSKCALSRRCLCNYRTRADIAAAFMQHRSSRSSSVVSSDDSTSSAHDDSASEPSIESSHQSKSVNPGDTEVVHAARSSSTNYFFARRPDMKEAMAAAADGSQGGEYDEGSEFSDDGEASSVSSTVSSSVPGSPPRSFGSKSTSAPVAASPAMSIAALSRPVQRPNLRKAAATRSQALSPEAHAPVTGSTSSTAAGAEASKSADTDSSNVIFPRRKQGQHKKHGRKEGVVVTMDILETVFHMPLHKACNELGVCATALKRACRKLGVQKWPYRDQQSRDSQPCRDHHCNSQRMVASSQDGLHRKPSGSAPAPRGRGAPVMRDSARPASMRPAPARSGARPAMQFPVEVKMGHAAPMSRGNSAADLREASSDFESSVDTAEGVDDEHGMDQVQTCEYGVAPLLSVAPSPFGAGMSRSISSTDLVAGGSMPRSISSSDFAAAALSTEKLAGMHAVWGDPVSTAQDEDGLDSFDSSEEDGLVSEHLHSAVWDVGEAALATLGVPGSLSLEECLKV